MMGKQNRLVDLGNGRVVDLDASQTNFSRWKCERSLYEFLRQGWRNIDPVEFTEGWPIQAVAEHLEAVTYGHIKRLIINIPPRMGKSSITSVAFPAWTWAQRTITPTSGPGVQFLHASYAQLLALRDSTKCRRLIESDWYQQRWGDRFHLTADQNTKTRFDNNMGGSRLATSVGSALTGEGGSIIVVDDPNNAQEAFSEATIQATIEWWDSALSTRLNNPKTGAFVVIQQRLSEEDLTGHILSKDEGEWTHLCLPMRFEPERRTYNVILPAEMDDEGKEIPAYVWTDPREEPGELLWQDRMGEREVEILEKQLGPWSAAGQLQQRPEPKGGGVIKREWWQLWDQDAFPGCDYIIASLDTAYTTKTENDLSALTIWGIFSGGDQKAQAVATRIMAADGEMLANVTRSYSEEHPRVMLMYAWQERLELHELVVKVQETMRRFKVDKLLIENKAAGHSVAQEIRRLYGHENFAVQLVDPKGQDKLARLYSVQHLFAEGMIYAPDRAWADMVITQCGTFPKGKHDDLVDTVSMGLRYLRETGLIIRNDEWTSDIEDKMMFSGSAPPPLYTV